MKFDPQKLIGLTEQEAVEAIKKVGLLPRVKRREQQKFMGLQNFLPHRINIEIDDGKVSKVYIG